MNNSLLLIGGSNIDFIATCSNKLVKHTSNIGTVSITNGGVMRNIAENLARLGNKVDFITAIGNDPLGVALRQELLDLGINVYTPEITKNTGSYVAINDYNHDLYAGVCDNQIFDDLSIDFLKSHENLIRSHEYIGIDTNLNQETIDFLVNNFPDKKFIVDGISPTKVLKIKNYLDKLFLIKCNIYEARALMGIDLVEKDLVSGLLARGAQNVVVSHGSQDIYFGSNHRKVDLVHVEEVKDFVNTIGCGDALTSGVIDYFLAGKKLKEAVAFGNELSRVVLMSKGATSKEISKFANK